MSIRTDTVQCFRYKDEEKHVFRVFLSEVSNSQLNTAINEDARLSFSGYFQCSCVFSMTNTYSDSNQAYLSIFFYKKYA